MEMIATRHKTLSVRKQCEILSVPRSSLYYQPIPEKPENVKMMNLMDKHLLMHSTEGVVSMVDWLKEGLSYRSKTNSPVKPGGCSSSNL